MIAPVQPLPKGRHHPVWVPRTLDRDVDVVHVPREAQAQPVVLHTVEYLSRPKPIATTQQRRRPVYAAYKLSLFDIVACNRASDRNGATPRGTQCGTRYRMTDPLTSGAVSYAVNIAARASAFAAKKLANRRQLAVDPASVERRIISLARIKTLLSHSLAVDLGDIFIVPEVQSTHSDDEKPMRKHLRSLAEDLSYDGHYLFTGLAGQGKSVLLRWLAVQVWADHESDRLPVLIELRRLNTATNLEVLIRHELDLYGVPEDASVSSFLQDHNVVLMLDGFDEVDIDRREPLRTWMEKLLLRSPSICLIVSSRPELQIETTPAELKRFVLSPLKCGDLGRALDRVCRGSDSESIPRIKDALRHSMVSEILVNPMMLTLLVFKFRYSAEVPQLVTDFYEDLFELLVSRHDSMKGLRRERPAQVAHDQSVRLILEAACFDLRRESSSSAFRRSVLEEAFNRACMRVINENRGSDCLRDVCETTTLIVRDGDTYQFLHKSILEFFSARYVSRLREKARCRFYQVASGRLGHFLGELRFLRALDPVGYDEYCLLPRLDAALGGEAETREPSTLELAALVSIGEQDLVALDQALAAPSRYSAIGSDSVLEEMQEAQERCLRRLELAKQREAVIDSLPL